MPGPRDRTLTSTSVPAAALAPEHAARRALRTGSGVDERREDLATPVHVLGHLLDELVDRLEPQRGPQVRDELDRDALAVEVEVGAVEDVRLDATLVPVEGRVRADRDRSGERPVDG